MTNAKQRAVLLLTGPVGVGKSTSAQATAAGLRASGAMTACVDLDQLYCMLRQRDGFGEPDIWRMARQSAAVLTNQLLRDAMHVVVVEGGFLTSVEQHEFLDLLDEQLRVVSVTLHADYDTVHARVMADQDPGRVASKVPTFLRMLYREYELALPHLRATTTCFATDALSLDAVVAQVASLLDPFVGSSH